MKLRFTPPALADLDDVLNYLRASSPIAANDLSLRIEAVLERVVDNPMSGLATTEPDIRYINTHPYPYLIFYRPYPGHIEVIAIRHGARNPASMPAQPR